MSAGAQIVWVLEQGPQFEDGTAQLCDEVMDDLGSGAVGLCVGDNETQPEPGTFDESPFSLLRGFDLVVPRTTMEVLWSSSHGTPQGNENLDGDAVLDVVREIVGSL